jgi:hypothetical protein
MDVLRLRALSLALLSMSFTAACIPKAPLQTEWVAVGGGAEDLEAARNACRARAAEATKTVRSGAVGTEAAGGVFMECMREKGWDLREKP